MKRKPPNAGKGRPKGSLNKAPGRVKEAIVKVLESNTENFSKWLAAVAEGEKEYRYNEDGKAILNDKGEHLFDWLRRPEPGDALKLAMDMNEYHMPKQARVTVDGELNVRGSLIIRD